MLRESEELGDFLNDQAKEEGDYIRSEANLYPTERIFWFDSRYLAVDSQGKRYLRAEGKLVYRGFGLKGKEKYLLKSKLGSFKLRKDEGKLFITDYFTSRPGPLNDINSPES